MKRNSSTDENDPDDRKPAAATENGVKRSSCPPPPPPPLNQEVIDLTGLLPRAEDDEEEEDTPRFIIPPSDVIAIAEWRKTNAGRFRCPTMGPVADLMTCESMLVAAVVEHLCAPSWGVLHQFLVENEADATTFGNGVRRDLDLDATPLIHQVSWIQNSVPLPCTPTSVLCFLDQAVEGHGAVRSWLAERLGQILVIVPHSTLTKSLDESSLSTLLRQWQTTEPHFASSSAVAATTPREFTFAAVYNREFCLIFVKFWRCDAGQLFHEFRTEPLPLPSFLRFRNEDGIIQNEDKLRAIEQAAKMTPPVTKKPRHARGRPQRRGRVYDKMDRSKIDEWMAKRRQKTPAVAALRPPKHQARFYDKFHYLSKIDEWIAEQRLESVHDGVLGTLVYPKSEWEATALEHYVPPTVWQTYIVEHVGIRVLLDDQCAKIAPGPQAWQDNDKKTLERPFSNAQMQVLHRNYRIHGYWDEFLDIATPAARRALLQLCPIVGKILVREVWAKSISEDGDLLHFLRSTQVTRCIILSGSVHEIRFDQTGKAQVERLSLGKPKFMWPHSVVEHSSLKDPPPASTTSPPKASLDSDVETATTKAAVGQEFCGLRTSLFGSNSPPGSPPGSNTDKEPSDKKLTTSKRTKEQADGEENVDSRSKRPRTSATDDSVSNDSDGNDFDTTFEDTVNEPNITVGVQAAAVSPMTPAGTTVPLAFSAVPHHEPPSTPFFEGVTNEPNNAQRAQAAAVSPMDSPGTTVPVAFSAAPHHEPPSNPLAHHPESGGEDDDEEVDDDDEVEDKPNGFDQLDRQLATLSKEGETTGEEVEDEPEDIEDESARDEESSHRSHSADDSHKEGSSLGHHSDDDYENEEEHSHGEHSDEDSYTDEYNHDGADDLDGRRHAPRRFYGCRLMLCVFFSLAAIAGLSLYAHETMLASWEKFKLDAEKKATERILDFITDESQSVKQIVDSQRDVLEVSDKLVRRLASIRHDVESTMQSVAEVKGPFQSLQASITEWEENLKDFRQAVSGHVAILYLERFTLLTEKGQPSLPKDPLGLPIMSSVSKVIAEWKRQEEMIVEQVEELEMIYRHLSKESASIQKERSSYYLWG